MNPNAAAADEFTTEANAEIAALIANTAKTAKTLTDYTAAAEVNIDRLALHGTPEALHAWRTTRIDDARLRELIARWREHWRQATLRRSGVPERLRPRGLDLYAWENPEGCDHETVRLGATHRQINGAPLVDLVHVDLVRVAQQSTNFRLLGPTEALEMIGNDGLVQEGHPLRCGTTHSGYDNIYHPRKPTWTPPRPPAHTPSHHGWSPQASAPAGGAYLEGGVYRQ